MKFNLESTTEDFTKIRAWTKTRLGIALSKKDDTCLYVNFKEVPPLLAESAALGVVMNISRLSDHGVSITLMAIPLIGVPQVEFDAHYIDSVVFVPMANISSISSVGLVTRKG
ncbi:hypothetical protein [Thiolinea disciformis]|uniref:hypothetical protein n=1 Tax=Thiolinea disciformis TaxID=125614 RepID=UPI000380076A|nr:hypothetical protein [Thiolinea disciformis]